VEEGFLYCPVCGKRYRRWPNLKVHFRKEHITQKCVVCGYRLKKHAEDTYMQHLRAVIKRNDEYTEEHKILFALVASRHNRTDFYKECVDLAVRELSKGKIRWGN